MRPRVAMIVAHGVAGAALLVAVPGCDTGTTTPYPSISYSYPTFVTLAPPTTPFDPLQAIPVNPAPPVSLALPPEPLIVVTTTTTVPPPLPPTCVDLLAAIQAFTGAAGFPSGEEYDAANGHSYVRCYGTVVTAGDATPGARNAAFEIWAYPKGTYPAGLTDAGSPFTDPAAFASDAAFDPGITVTTAPIVIAKETSNVRRAARFSCGSFECWMYLEEGTSYPPDPDSSVLDGHIAGIVASLGSTRTEPVPPSTPLPAQPRPTCDMLISPIETILAIFKVAPVGRTDDVFPDDAARSYVGCYGALYLIPPSVSDPTPSSRNVAFQIFVFDRGQQPAFLRLTPTPKPTPELGEGVTSDGGSLTVIRSEKVAADGGITLMHNSVYDFNFYRLGGGGEPYDLRTTDARRTIRFPCGGFDCYVALAETAYAPPDPDLTLIDAQLRIFISATKAYMATIPAV